MSDPQSFLNRTVAKWILIAGFLGVAIATIQPATAQTLITLHSFRGGTDGANPYFGDLILDGSGNLYGTTFAGGASTLGVVFVVTPAGIEHVLHAFSSADGCSPYAGLIHDGQGNLYGTTSACGASGFGTVFKLSNKGVATVLYNFNGGADGGQPFAALVRDASGNLYGTTNEGGVAGCLGLGCGTVFKVTPTGTESVLHSFKGAKDGENPVGALVLDASGNLYGTTGQGGADCCGTVFKIAPSGTEIRLFSFSFTNGSGPGPNRLILQAGKLFGTTSGGGTSGDGALFELSNGVETVLYNFDAGFDGASPYGGVIRDASGNLYGTTFGGAGTGCNDVGCGTIYQLSPSGVLTVLHTFTGGSDGGNPAGGLVVDAAGNLYGTTENGGTHGVGTVFKLTP